MRSEKDENEMIRFKSPIENISEYQSGPLPKNAIRIETPSTIEELMKKATPIAVILCVSLFAAMLVKNLYCREMVIAPFMIPVGFFIGFCLLIVHEWLHAIVYPRDAKVTIGRMRGKITFVALASYPLTRRRFVLMSILPFVLGLLPLGLFILGKPEWRIFNGLMFGMAGIGMVSPFPDVYNVLTVLRKAERTDYIMFCQDDLFRVPSEEKS